MKKALGLAVSVVLLAGCAGLRPYPMAKRPIAAVVEFDYSAPDKEFSTASKGLADALVNGLVRSGRLRLVERRKLEAAMGEAALSMTGAVDPGRVAEVGKLVGANYVIVGSVTQVSVRDEGRSAVVATKTTRTAEVMAEARMFEVSTGLLVATGVARGRAEGSEKHLLRASTGVLPDKTALVSEAMMGMGDRLAAELAESVQPLDDKGGR